MDCTNQEVFTLQAQIMKTCIEEDKWFLSEKCNPPHDVGWEAAQEHFAKTHANGFATGFRACYCALVCPNRKTPINL